ncbi:17828_t:CDS:1, partial [Cetraspora pellucida]
MSKNNNQRHETTITYSDINEFVYNSLISLKNTNNFYENDNIKLVISFDVELFSLITIILDEDKENLNNNKKLYLEVAHCIAKFIENEDGY